MGGTNGRVDRLYAELMQAVNRNVIVMAERHGISIARYRRLLREAFESIGGMGDKERSEDGLSILSTGWLSDMPTFAKAMCLVDAWLELAETARISDSKKEKEYETYCLIQAGEVRYVRTV